MNVQGEGGVKSFLFLKIEDDVSNGGDGSEQNAFCF